jgi:hypothetical protein
LVAQSKCFSWENVSACIRLWIHALVYATERI